MPLRVNEKIGFGAAVGEEPLINLSVGAGANLKNYNVFTEASAVGDPTANVTNGIVRVFLGNNAVIGSTSTATPALTSGTGWGTGWKVEIVVEGSNHARVIGAGGDGGQGNESFDTIFGNFVSQCSGGGGGGGGDDVGAGGDGGGSLASADGKDGTATAGGAGGIGNSTTAGNRSATAGGDGGPAMEATADCDIDLAPETDATLEVWGGGGGGGGGGGVLDTGADGGAGGAPASAGSAGGGALGVAGGAAGSTYTGSGTVTEIGPGTIDTDGP